MKGDIIPNGEFLYKYLNPKSLPEGQSEIPFGIFSDNELSCDWAQLQKKPEQSFHIKEGKNIIIRILVCDEIRKPCNPKVPNTPQPQWEQSIEHDPIKKGEDLSHPLIENLSHSLIKGSKKVHVTKAIASKSHIYKIVSESEEEEGDKQEVPLDIAGIIFIALLFCILLLVFFKTLFNL
jgi:hypothetical protein